MKNLFKNLMLVAVAAMGFTACEQVIDDVNATNEKFTVNIVGEFADDTRSGFLEKEKDATAYKSAWDGSETVRFAIIPDTFGDNDTATCDDVKNESKGDRATFAPTFDSNEGTIHAFSPKGYFDKNNISACKGGFTSNPINLKFKNVYVVVPAEQTTTAISVDPAAHILAGKADFAENVNMTFNHVVAYGKMQIKNFDGTIDKVEITASKPLAGVSCKYYYADSDENSAGELVGANVDTITINNHDEAKDNKVFWFGCAPADLTDTTLKVKIYSGEDTYTRNVAINRTLKFQQGRVASFGVDMTGVEADVKEEVVDPTTLTYTLVTDVADLAVGDKVVIAASGFYSAMGASRGNNFASVEITKDKDNNTITFDNNVLILTLEAGTEANTYAFKTTDGYLYAASSGSNHLKTQETLDANASWTIAIAANGGVATIKAQGTNTRNWMRYNSTNNPPIFSCYGSGQADICIYKGVEAGTDEPDDQPTALDAPDLTTSVVGNSITVEWEAVDGAKDYTITMEGRDPATITETSKTFSNLAYDTNYKFTVVANPMDTDAYVSSTPAIIEDRTDADPNATVKTDDITINFIDITYNSYTDWNGKNGISGAVYAGNSLKNNTAIQLRSDENTSGIVTTTSGGNIKKVVVEWASNTTAGRTLDIYGKNVAYTSPSVLYSDTDKGEKLGSIVCGTSTELTVNDNYAYIGLRSNKGALYVESISIYWEPSNGEPVLTKLDTPENLQTTDITENSITLNWDIVENASSYNVTYGSESKTVNTNEYKITGLTAATSYNISVMANGDEVSYLDSDSVEVTATTLTAEEPEQPSEPEQPGTGAQFVKVTSAPSDWSGTYLIVYEDGNVAFDGSRTTLDAVSNTKSVKISNGVIEATDAMKAITFEIAKSGSNYTIKSKSGYYIGQTKNDNGLKSSTSPEYANTISINADGSVNLVSYSAYLRYNAASNQLRFRYYKSSSYAGQKAIQLYKLSE